MTAILYGNLRVEIVGNAGARVQRVPPRRAVAELLAHRQPDAPPEPLMLGRNREAADAFATIAVGRPAEFYAACGYGKTTLLRYVVAAAAQRGLAPSCIYLRADGDRVGDLLQDLVTRLYVFDRPVKLTQEECGQLLGQVSAIVAIDDLRVSDDQLGYLLEVLSGCSLVIGSAQPVLGRRGSSRQLDGLPDESALALVAGNLGRPLAAEEVAAAGSLVTAVDGQPLHLRQCAALAREGRHTLRALARQAAGDPEILDRLSINALAQHQRRALAALALAAGTLLPADVVDAIGQVSYLAQWLQSLHGRGLAEQCEDRFGLPACKAQGYRQLLLKDLDLAIAARGLSNWLTAADPTAADSQSAAEAALTMMEFAAERGEWTSVLQLARAAERVLFLAGRWEAWHDTLSRGLDAARATADKASEAFFVHQQGTLAFCQDQLEDAYQLLRQALTLREQIGDADGASVTRHNLRLLKPPDAPSPPRSGGPRRVLHALGGVLGTVALVVSTVLITGVLRAGGTPPGGGPSESPSTPVTQTTDPGPASNGAAPASNGAAPASNGAAPASNGAAPASSDPAPASSDPAPPSSGPASPSGQPSNSRSALIPQVISFTSSPPQAAVVRDTYVVTVSGGGSGNSVVLSIAPGSAAVCSISGATVTFGQPGRCVIDANQAGNARYLAAPQAQQVITVTGIPQLIRFTAPAQGQVGRPARLSAAGGGSGNPVEFSVDSLSDPGVCGVSGAHGTTLSYTASGRCVIDANQAGNAQYLAAPQAQQVVAVTGIPQSVTITSKPPDDVYQEVTYGVTATGGGSGNPVTFGVDASSTSSACTISGATVTFGQPGRCVIDANQAGNARYQAAPQAQQVITVDRIPQSIAFTSEPSANPAVDGSYVVTATGGGSGNPVTFGVDASSTSSACTISGATVTFGQLGRCVIDANQAGNAQYLAAPQAQQVVAVTGIPQSVTITSKPPDDVYQEVTYGVTATGGGSGNPVTFGVDASSTSSACTISGATVTFGQPGRCVIDANQAGNARYQAAPQAQQVITVDRIPQSIAFTSEPSANPAVDGSYVVTATGGGSGNPVTFGVDASSTSSACTISGATVTFGQPGRCVIDANQAGNARYLAAPQAQQVITVTGIPQLIRFTAPAQGQVGRPARLSAAGGGSGNPVEFSVDSLSDPGVCGVSGAHGTTLSYTASGRCVIDANQAGNAQYLAAPQAQQVVAVTGIPQSVTITSKPPDDVYQEVTYGVTATGGGSGNPVTFGVDASSTSSACTISGATVTFGQPGRCVIDANQAGNARYQAAPQAQQVITVTGIPQLIRFTAPAQGQVARPARLSAAGGGSGNPVEFSVDSLSDPGVCGVSGAHGTTLSYTASGRCVIDANQAGNAQYLAAPQAQQAIVVTGIPQLIQFTAPAQGWVDGSATLSATGGGSGNPVEFSVDHASDKGVCNVSGDHGTTVSHTASGRCVIDANQAGDARYQRAPQVQQTIDVTSRYTSGQQPVPRPAGLPGAAG